MLFVFLILLSFSGFSQNSGKHQDEVVDYQKWVEITEGKNYDENDDENDDDIIDPPEMKQFFQIPEYGQFFAYGILIVILAVLVYFLISEIILTKKIGIGFGHDKKISVHNFDDDLEKPELDRLLQEALDQNLLHVAVRIRFLLLLRFLSEKKILRFKAGKTNRNYIDEMAQYGHHNDFMKIVLIFEKIWYGNIAVDQRDFVIISNLFNNFSQQFSEHEK